VECSSLGYQVTALCTMRTPISEQAGDREDLLDGGFLRQCTQFIAGVFWCGAASKDSKEERLF